MIEADFFSLAFKALTDNTPLRWQKRLYNQMRAGNLPVTCDLPTGLGKTSVIPIWLIAFASQIETNEVPRLPRRLIYIVNRRTVVDQATAIAERLRRRLLGYEAVAPDASKPLDQLREALERSNAVSTGEPIAISTLRGELADNEEWKADPARPAIIVGTIDMIGSKLLFSGYGDGFRMRPHHAGLIGQDTLIVHDEAHLTPPFNRLLWAVEAISPATVRRILAAHRLQPWRQHGWLHPTQPRDAAFSATVSELLDLYTRPLSPEEVVLSVGEKTALQPRPRQPPTLPAPPQNRPNRHEHQYKRAGARKLFAAFDPRAGKVYGHGYERKRQRELIAFLEALAAEIDPHIHTIHLVCDHVSTHHGKEVRRWLSQHPRVVMPFTPGHCSWMNHVEQWLSMLQRKRWRIVDFDSKDHLRAKLAPFVRAWNQQAHPCNWSTKCVVKVMAAAPAMAA